MTGFLRKERRESFQTQGRRPRADGAEIGITKQETSGATKSWERQRGSVALRTP